MYTGEVNFNLRLQPMTGASAAELLVSIMTWVNTVATVAIELYWRV